MSGKYFKEILNNYRTRRITLREAAELLGVHYWEMQDILDSSGIPVSDISDEDIESRLTKTKSDSY